MYIPILDIIATIKAVTMPILILRPVLDIAIFCSMMSTSLFFSLETIFENVKRLSSIDESWIADSLISAAFSLGLKSSPNFPIFDKVNIFFKGS